MSRLGLTTIGPLLRERRGSTGIRTIATEIGISSATLSRVENGKLPDLETFAKICKWLKLDPSEILGCAITDTKEKALPVTAHLRAHKTLNADTAKALAELIIRSQRMVQEISRSH
jgi:transcriptional regulator with XRE-family HTH domain